MEEIKISVIIPVYKVEQYLRQCVDSVLDQTYRNIEIILVDDGSPDQCPAICEEYAKKDDRVRVIHKQNGGSSSARNAGMKCVTGAYVMFVDGDDWIELDTLEICVNELHKDENIGCILFSYAKELPSNSIPMHIMDKTEHFLGDRAEKIIYRRLFGLSNQELAHPERMENIVSCCMKLYRVDFAVKGQYFDTKEVGSCEDGLFNMYALHKCHNMLYLDRPMYHYRKAGNSLTSTFRPRFIQQWETLFSVMDNIIYEKHLGYDCKEALNNRIALSITAVGLNELSNPEHRNMEHIRVIRSYLKKDYYREAIRKMQMANMPFAWKILMKSCKMRLSWVTYGIIVAIKKMKMRG